MQFFKDGRSTKTVVKHKSDFVREKIPKKKATSKAKPYRTAGRLNITKRPQNGIRFL